MLVVLVWRDWRSAPCFLPYHETKSWILRSTGQILVSFPFQWTDTGLTLAVAMEYVSVQSTPRVLAQHRFCASVALGRSEKLWHLRRRPDITCAMKWTCLETNVLLNNVLQTVSLGKIEEPRKDDVSIRSSVWSPLLTDSTSPQSFGQTLLANVQESHVETGNTSSACLVSPRKKKQGSWFSQCVRYKPWLSSVPDFLPLVSSLKLLIWNCSFD